MALKGCRSMTAEQLDGEYSRLCVSPFGIKSMLLQNIDKQIALGKNGYICIKANSVTEREVIDKPAEASCAVWKLPVLCRIWSCGSSLNGYWIRSCVILQRQALCCRTGHIAASKALYLLVLRIISCSNHRIYRQSRHRNPPSLC